MASTSLIDASEVDSTFGCLFIAMILTSALWGVGCLQFYQYCEKFWNTERRWLKLYMTSIWILDTAHQVLMANNYYMYFVKGIANPTLLGQAQKTRPAMAVLTAFIDAMVQGIFIRRAWYLSGENRILTGALSVVVFAQFALAMAYFGRFVKISDINLLDNLVSIELAAAATTVLTDTFLASTLIWLLRKSRSGLKRSDSIVNRLVAYIIGSSLVTAICALVALISAAAAPHSFIFLIPDALISKLYFNCLLASFNARLSLRAAAEHDSGDISIHLVNFVSSSTAGSSCSPNDFDKVQNSKAIECRVNIEIE